MTKQRGLLVLVPFCLSTVVACGGGSGGTGTGTGAAGSSGTAGSTGAGGDGTTGAGGSDTTGAGGSDTTGAGGSGTGAGGSDTTGAGGSGTGAGGSVTTGASGAGGSTATGAAGTTGAAGATGAAGTTGAAGATGAGGSVGKPTGMSAGCNQAPPAGDSNKNFVKYEVNNIVVNPIYMAGGKYVQTSGNYNFTFRPYAVRLPTGYDPSKPYAVSFGGGGCGGSASGFAGGPNGGLTLGPNPNTDVLQVGLSYVAGCFADGGPAIGNRDDTPEEPYFRAVLAAVEKTYCIDKSRVFIAGSSSGAWESYTLGCAAGDVIRGIAADEGGMRATRPACKGPVAALLVAGAADTENPVGPLSMTDPAYGRLGSAGSAPGRDDLLTRNGCVGTATAVYDPMYPECMKYTGCPAAYPVVWCELPGVGHNASSYGGVNYSPGPMWKFLSSLPTP
jgi:hypothetical protein